jgi:hypothetical protein
MSDAPPVSRSYFLLMKHAPLSTLRRDDGAAAVSLAVLCIEPEILSPAFCGVGGLLTMQWLLLCSCMTQHKVLQLAAATVTPSAVQSMASIMLSTGFRVCFTMVLRSVE